MPKESELPAVLKPLARRQAVQIRHANFSSDAESLIKKLREALGYDSSERRRWRMLATKVIAATVVLFQCISVCPLWAKSGNPKGIV